MLRMSHRSKQRRVKKIVDRIEKEIDEEITQVDGSLINTDIGMPNFYDDEAARPPNYQGKACSF